MNSTQVKEKNAAKNEAEKNSADPFASDIFASARLEENIEPEISPQAEVEKPAWVWRLPKISGQLNDWNALRKNLPADFSDDLPKKLADSLAKLLNFGASNPIEFLLLTERETSEIVETDDSWWLNFGFQTGKPGFAVEIDDIFAVWLVDAMLGEKKSDREKIRNLTASEIAVLEFVAVNLTNQANKILNAPLFKFRGLSRKLPALAKQKNADSENPFLVANWQTIHGFLNSIVKIYAVPETFKALDVNENELLTVAPRRQIVWNSLKNRVKEVRSRLFLGEAQMTLNDAAGLETGDVVLPENLKFSVKNGELNGSAEVFLSDGEHIKINGLFIPSENESSIEFEEPLVKDEILVRRVKSNQNLRLTIVRFDETENPQFFEKFMSNEEIESNGLGETSLAETGDGNGIALENLAVTLRVELEARRLSLEEVGNLRINQVIELGASAADPVNLLIDNKIVARGELVEVENRLGVRIVQILR